MGSRHKTRRRQVTSIPPMPVTLGSATPVTVLDIQFTMTLQTQVETIQTESVPESLMSIPIVEAPMLQPRMDSQLGESYITIT